ncbi:MAG: Gfo/Idh/MocA family oxidoreductase [Rhizomicrobium sp.]
MPFRAGIHPRNWRAFIEFGNGYMGDIGVHFIDACRFLLDLRWPTEVASRGGVYVDTDSAATVPDTQIASFQFDGPADDLDQPAMGRRHRSRNTVGGAALWRQGHAAGDADRL